MESNEIKDLSKLCVHTITTKPWALETAVDKFSKKGISGITIWRDALDGLRLHQVKSMLDDNGMDVVSLCRGGFLASVDKQKRTEAIDDNKKAIEEAAEIGAPLVVLVCGADPAQHLEESRKQIQEGIEMVLPFAKERKVKLAIEPLHPMYADTRSAINTLKQANDMCVNIDDVNVGVAVDVFHLWWDETLEQEITRVGEINKLFAFHICDWKTPTTDMLLDRGLMGEGCIPVKKIRSWVEEAGFAGYNEVEIFSNRYWEMDQDEFLEKIIQAYLHKS
ncbi:MAG: sugar phosphate isomerase/epimerase [Melioribacteraceae bacterium]|nr:sugar phosphate isomerase/epimerase [Melioribacteraceae bacterium]